MTKKIWKTGSTDQRHQNARLNHADTEENRPTVDELADLVNDKGQKWTHHLTHQISTKTGLIQCVTVQIIHRNFDVKCHLSSNTPVAY